MKIIDFSCSNYRNIQKINIIPCDGMNVICGENAQGKTNLLEAIWLFTGAKSFRTAKDSSFVKFNKEKAKCQISFISNKIKNEAVIEIKEHRQAFINQKKLKSPSELAGKFNAIVFSPGDLSLVKDGPAIRRRFLDTAIGQIYPAYIFIIKKYIRAVTQRNKIIKDYRYDSSLSIMLDVFEKEIATYGKKIIEARKKYLNQLGKFIPDIYNGISSGKENLKLNYICYCETDDIEEKLKKSRKEDMFTGVTSLGPHRDDLDFKINDISVRNFGSQGQKRSVSLSVKLSEAEVINKITGEYPVFLLDDVMSELDVERQNYILNHIKGIQSFLTCCDPANLINLKLGKIFNIKDGRVVN